MSDKGINVKEFASRVERLCDFFIDQAIEDPEVMTKNDIRVLQNLKEEAADIQFTRKPINLDGLQEYMGGLPKEKT